VGGGGLVAAGVAAAVSRKSLLLNGMRICVQARGLYRLHAAPS
jgi:hypothetical protein